MSWKEFFRPTKRKLAATLVLFVLFVPVLMYPIGAFCIGCQSTMHSLANAAFHIIEGDRDVTLYGHYFFSPVFFISIIPEAILCYLLACALAHLLAKKPEKTGKKAKR